MPGRCMRGAGGRGGVTRDRAGRPQHRRRGREGGGGGAEDEPFLYASRSFW